MFKRFSIAFTLTAATLSYAHKAPSKQDQINAKLDQMQQTLDQISAILKEADAPPPPTKVDVAGAHTLGVPDTLVTVIEYTDMQCPYCSKFHQDTFPKLHDAHIATGEIQFVSKDLPLPFHKNAHQAAEAGLCAGEQLHYWEMRDRMQSNPGKLELADLEAYAGDLDLDLNQYRECMATGRYKSVVDADAAEAQKLGITGTPAFVIGRPGVGKDRSIVTGQVITGNQPFPVFEKAILAVRDSYTK